MNVLHCRPRVFSVPFMRVHTYVVAFLVAKARFSDPISIRHCPNLRQFLVLDLSSSIAVTLKNCCLILDRKEKMKKLKYNWEGISLPILGKWTLVDIDEILDEFAGQDTLGLIKSHSRKSKTNFQTSVSTHFIWQFKLPAHLVNELSHQGLTWLLRTGVLWVLMW